jgi:hypothetical protein
MTIEVSESLLHWNYFLALEEDLSQVSRYIEFSEKNFQTYSIELAHLLLASASEVDVIAKGLCIHLEPAVSVENINGYKKIITNGITDFADEPVFVPRFGLTLHPWSTWSGNHNPIWWRSYNKVKHERNDHFPDANLKNTLNAMAGLLVAVFHFYRLEQGKELSNRGYKETTRYLNPESRLLRLNDNYYHGHLLLE